MLMSTYSYADLGVTEITASPKSYCKNEVQCETTCKNAPVRIVEKVIYKDKIVYRDKPIQKIVYVDKPVEKVVYKDKIVEKEKVVYKNVQSKPNGKLQFNLLVGMGENALYTEIDQETNEYNLYRDQGLVVGSVVNYRFNNDLILGFGALSNETYFGTVGVSTSLLD